MADFTQIIQEINDDINTNGVGAITGAKLNEVLRDMIAAVNAAKQDPLTIDAIPTEGSTNPVQSGGVYEALEDKADKRTFEVLHIHQIPIDIASGLLVGDFVIDTSDGKRLYLVTYRNANDFLLVTSDGINLVWYSYENNQYSDDGFFDSSIVERDILELSNRLDGKQDTISDLADIRSGAAAGATAYQKPSGGIPKTDLASGVQTSLGKADTALQSYTETDPVFSASPAAGITSGDISSWDGKAEPIEIVDASTPPMTMQPDKVYQYGTLSGDTTFPLLLFINDGKAHIHCWTFTTPATAPTITWPSGITAWAGGSAPTINASKSYEVSVMDGLATIIES